MSRYLERADNVSRLLNVAFHLELDLAGLTPSDYESPWSANLAILQTPLPESLRDRDDAFHEIAAWLTFDLDNPASILSCVNRARNNARSIRGSIGPEVWRALNTLYWQLRDPDFETRARESPHEYHVAVESGNHLFQGVCDATLARDEGWEFIQLGKYLERAERQIRVLDVNYRRLRAISDQADHPLAAVEWGAVLKACSAFETYQRIYTNRVEPERVVEFVLLNSTFPRSVRFSLERAADALRAIEGPVEDRGDGRAERLLGRLIAELRYLEPDQVLENDFHGFMTGLLARCNQVGRSIQEQYSLVN